MTTGNLPESGDVFTAEQKAAKLHPSPDAEKFKHRCVDCGQWPFEVDAEDGGLTKTTCPHNDGGYHCQDCGQVDCVCCEECDTYPCECQPQPDEYGKVPASFRSITPWAERGIAINHYDSTAFYPSWQAAWPLLVDPEHGHEKTDVCQCAADFYLLDALKAGVINTQDATDASTLGALAALDHEVRFSRHVAGQMHDDLIGWLDPLFRQYVDMACGGELRHHKAVGGGSVSHERREAWANWRHVRDVVGVQALKDMADLFYDWGKTGNTGYGGPLWAQGAELLYERELGNITGHQWCDRVFTLVHNGGPFLNKLSWGIQNEMQWGLDYLQSKVLPAHASDNFTLLLRVASKDVKRLWDEYWRAMNRVRIRSGCRPAANLRTNTRKRTLCRYCWANPRVGHTLKCHLFRGEYLSGQSNGDTYPQADMLLTVTEDEWSEYDHCWAVWQLTDQPVSPDGKHVKITAETPLKIEFMAEHGLSVASKTVQCTAMEAMSLVFKPDEVFPSHHSLWKGVPENYKWHLFVYSGNTHMGSYSSKSVHGYDKFAGLTIDCGLVMPAAILDLDWSSVVSKWQDKVISA